MKMEIQKEGNSLERLDSRFRGNDKMKWENFRD